MSSRTFLFDNVPPTGIPVPDELKLMDRIDRKLGGFWDRPINDDRGVMEAYSLLQVIEERALHRVVGLVLEDLQGREADPETGEERGVHGPDCCLFSQHAG